jgi:hypothetical protein
VLRWCGHHFTTSDSFLFLRNKAQIAIPETGKSSCLFPLHFPLL